MGRFVDLNSPLSEEDKSYLRSRGRGYLIPANERRFGSDGKKEPAPHEAVVGSPAQSPFYSSPDRNAATYDLGGAPLPGTTLSYDTGRTHVRDNGVEGLPTTEFNPTASRTTVGAHPSPFNPNDEVFTSVGDDDIDDDIVEHIQALSDAALNKELTENGIETPEKPASVKDKHLDELKEEAAELEIAMPAGYKKADIVKAIDDKYKELYRYQREDMLAVHLQDVRDNEPKEDTGDQSPEFNEGDEPA